jgi:hypothetical protein
MQEDDDTVTAHQDYVESAKGRLERVRILKAKYAYHERLKFTLETLQRSTQVAAARHLKLHPGGYSDDLVLARLQAKLMNVCHLSACLALFQYLSTWWISDSVGTSHKYDSSSPVSRLSLEAALNSLEPALVLLRDRYTKGYGSCQDGLKHNLQGTNSSLVGDLRDDCTTIPSRMCKDRESRLLSWRLSLEHGTIDAFQSQVCQCLPDSLSPHLFLRVHESPGKAKGTGKG